MHSHPHQDPVHTNPVIPHALQQTIEWLIMREEFKASRALIAAVTKAVPPEDPAASDYIASVLSRSKDYRAAVQQALHTLRLLPDSIEATFNAAKCYGSAGQPIEAERLMEKVVRARPDWVDPHIDLAVYIGSQGRFDEAFQKLESLLQWIPEGNLNRDVVRFNLGWHYMRLGSFKKGMQYLGIGRKLRIWGARASSYPRPILERGMDVRGKTILICGEGGAGDEIINLRFAQTIKERGGKVLWQPQVPLGALFSRSPDLERVVSRDISMLGGYDYWAPAMDLPHILELDLAEIPNRPYIQPEPGYVEAWRTKIPHRKGRLKVGLRWQGNALYEQDLMRSVPFAMLETLAEIPGIDFYSLQRDDGAEERPSDSPVVDLGPDLKTWDDTAAAISHMDLVISSCTSVPHLAAAMGKPTWIMIPLSPYYVWAPPGDKSQWYPSVQLFRQTRFGSWDEPFLALKTQLQALAEQTKYESERSQDKSKHSRRLTSPEYEAGQ